MQHPFYRDDQRDGDRSRRRLAPRAELVFEIRVEGRLEKSRPARFEIGDTRQATIIEPRAFTAELERLRAAGTDDDESRERALTCIVELLKFPLIRDGERGEALALLRDRLLAEEGAPKPPSVASIAREIFSANRGSKTIGEVARVLGVQLPRSDSALSSTSKEHLDLTFAGSLLTALSIDYPWSMDYGPVLTIVELARRFPASWTATFATGADEMARALAKRFGRPRALPSHHVYAERYLFATRGDEHRLSFFAELPAWASPPVDPSVRERTLRAIAEAARTAFDAKTVAQLMISLPDGCGIHPRPAERADIEVDLVPPMPAADVMRLFGLDGLAPLQPYMPDPPEGHAPPPIWPTCDRYLGTQQQAFPRVGLFEIMMLLETGDTIRRLCIRRT